MIIQRLNMDNSWHIQFAGKSIIVDPWLKGVEVDFFPWFNTQWHKTKPLAVSEVPDYDLVLITQKYPDHFHVDTLIELAPKCLLVPDSIAQKVKQILPQAAVWTFDEADQAGLGPNLRLHHLPSRRRIDPIYDALVLEDGDQSILLATHGYSPSERWTIKFKNLPPVKLAFTPFNFYKLPFFLGGVVSPGMPAVKELIRQIRPKHIVATHDEDKHAKGLVHRLAKVTFSPDEAQLLEDSSFKNRLLSIPNYISHTI